MSRKRRSLVHATVAKIVGDDYAVTYPVQDYGELTTDSSVTFSLSVWRGKRGMLSEGLVVKLSEVALHQQGWRAGWAQPVLAA